MKIFINSICKDEIKYIDDYINENINEVDGIYILDTGSTDGTYEKLVHYAKEVYAGKLFVNRKVYEKFDFSKARNDALEMLPKDVNDAWVIHLDIDDKIDWHKNDSDGISLKKALELALNNDCVMLEYIYEEIVENKLMKNYHTKINKINTYVWKNPIHELPYLKEEYSKNPKLFKLEKVIIKRREPTTLKDREFYIDMLEKCVINFPEYEEAIYYLLMGYFHKKDFYKMPPLLNKILSSVKLLNEYKMAACLLYSHMLLSLSDEKSNIEMAESYLWKALIYCPFRREPYFYLMRYFYENKKYIYCLWAGLSSLNIRNRIYDFAEDPQCWDENIYKDILLKACNEIKKNDLFNKFIETDLKLLIEPINKIS